LQASLHGLVRVGDAAHGQHLRFPVRGRQFSAEQLGRIFLNQDLRLEVESRGEAEIFVGGAGIAVDAAMLAPSVDVDAGVEADVGAFVGRNNRPGSVLEEMSFRRRVFGVNDIRITNILDWLEPVAWVFGCAPAMNGWLIGHKKRRRRIFAFTIEEVKNFDGLAYWQSGGKHVIRFGLISFREEKNL